MSQKKLNQLLKGKTTQLKNEDIMDILESIPDLGNANRKKLEKAYNSGKGCRIQLDEYEMSGSGFGSFARKGAKFVKNNKQLNKLKDQAINQGLNYAVNQSGLDDETGELVKGLARKTINNQFDSMAGSGFGSMARKSAKFVKNNKQLNKLKDQAINQGLNYAVNQSGLDENTGAFVKGLARKTINNQFDELAGSGIFNKNLGRKILKNGSKALKIGNKISNAMGYDDLDDMAIDYATTQTLGRIDPTLANIASKQLNKLADKQMDKYSGGSMNPYMPRMHGGSMTYNDLSNIVHSGHDAFHPSTMNLPMFDRMKFENAQMRGRGFVVR